MADAITLLQELGFTEHEARAYQALLQHNPATGYEVAKVSGIPRPNIYPVLQKLEARGAAVRIAGDETTRYLPIPPQEFLKRVDSQFQQTLAQVGPMLEAAAQPAKASHIWQTDGYENLVAQARGLIRNTESELLIALWPEEARTLMDDLEQVDTRDCKVTTLCLAACVQECGGCRGQIFRNKVVDTPDARWLLVVPDGSEALVGEIPANRQVSAVRTRQSLLVRMTSWFIQHAITLGVLLVDGEEILDRHLTAATRAVLADKSPNSPGSWLAAIRQLLRSSGGTTDLA
ncbi:MAG: TrmB family transcriptional regulator [Caldilineaceae bacterium]|nr:TrmB family transcriptional regulator [Caldilineaceae bacterium]